MKKDKFYHMIAGALAFLVGAFLFNNNIGLLFSILAGAGKEIYDIFDDETTKDVELFDFLATVAGGLIIYILFM